MPSSVKSSGKSMHGIIAVAASMIICLLFSIQQATPQEKALKKLYISSVKAEGVDEKLARKARDRMELSLYENFGREYRTLTDEDVRVMFKKAAEIMAAGCDAEACQAQIADAVDADEVIYGELSREGAQLKLSARTLLRDRKTLSISKKSMLVLSFAEKEIEHYCSEAAKKLINPSYSVQKPPRAAFDDKISLAAVKLEEVKGLDIAVLKFTADDETISGMLGYLKTLMEAGDAAFGAGKHDAALSKYRDILERVRRKLTAEKQEKMKDFSRGVIERCDASYAMKYKAIIEDLDKNLVVIGSAGEKDLLKLREKYGKIEGDTRSVADEFKGKGMEEIKKTLDQRHDGITTALAALREKKGDSLYADYAFAGALAEYTASEGYAGSIRGAESFEGLSKRYLDKQKAVWDTGRNYLLSRVRALCDRAEFFNLKDERSGAKGALKEAKKLISGELVIFATQPVVERYNAVAGVLGISHLSEEKDMEVFNAISKKNREDEENRKKELALEAMKKFKAKGGGKTKMIGGVEFVYIPGGEFMMGSPDGEGEGDEHPQHKVSVDGFWIGKYELTQAQYEAVMGGNPSHFSGANRPVEQVSWNDAVQFCESFSRRYGVKARLPTEAEWEYACRAGTITRYYWGDEIDGDYCWNYGNSGGKTHPVGTKRPNAWGLYDMSGNVWEWCADWYGEDYYRKSPENNPEGPSSGRKRVLRGGSWYSYGNYLRSAIRYGFDPGARSNGSFGFRPVLAP